MMIDTHCHLDRNDYENFEEILNHMRDNIMIASGADPDSNKNVIDLINEHDNIYGTIGLHPDCVNNYIEEAINFIEEYCTHPKVVGIGEIGLDYYWDKEHHDAQKTLFIKQLEIAKKYHKPVVIHSRDAANDTLDILKEHGTGLKIVLHCYGYSKEMALEFKKLGVKFGIGGVVTFKNGRRLVETVEVLELEDLLLETDSPYLTPEPFRGTKNEPYNIYYVAKKIAEIKNTTLENVLKTTVSTTISQFDLDI